MKHLSPRSWLRANPLPFLMIAAMIAALCGAMPVLAQSTPVPSGIVGWWPGDNHPMDIISGNDGTLQNGATYVAGKVGQTFSLDGADDYVSVPDSAALRPTNLTMEGWFTFASPGVAGLQTLISKTIGTGFLDSYVVWYDNGQLYATVCDSVGGDVINYSFTPSVGTWYHIAYTFDDATNNQTLYVNGVIVASGSTSRSISYDTHPVLIGGEYENEVLSYFFSGTLDEVSLYNRALSQAEIQAIFNADSNGKVKPTSVNSTADTDDGACSLAAAGCTLREAINAANSNADASEITFDATVFATAQTISLTGALPDLSENVTITGPGANLLTVEENDANKSFAIFKVLDGVSADFSGLTVSKGFVGIYNFGTVTITDCTADGNDWGFDNFTNGLPTNPTMTVTGCTASGNTNTAIFSDGTVTVTNSTVTGNNNGINISIGSTATIANCTVNGNGYGIYNPGAAATIKNTIATNNATGDVSGGASGTFVSGGYNLIGDGSAAPGFANGTNGDQVGTTANSIDAKLGALADNGGPTQTMALLSGSPAINAGSNANIPSGVTTDQRGTGFPRVVDGKVDIGAFESASTDTAQTGPNFVVNTNDDYDDGTCGVTHCSLREAINAANANPDASEITFASPPFDSVQTILIDSDLPSIGEETTITGPGANLLTVQENGSTQFLDIFTVDNNAKATFSGLTISGGFDGIFNVDGTLALSECILSDNDAGIENAGMATLTNCGFSLNTYGIGNTGGTLITNNCLFTDGFLGTLVYGGTLTATNCTYNNNNYGLGNDLSGDVTAIGCTFTNNFDGIDNEAGTVTTKSCTFNNNDAGIENYDTALITNCTFSGNTYGLDHEAGATTLTNCTISGNATTGILIVAGTVTAQNSIIVGNATDVDGTLTDDGNNILTGTAANAGLDPAGLQDNGGPTQTIALVMGSPAIDAANDANAPATDQRGIARPQGAHSDIGAYEALLLTIDNQTITEGDSGTKTMTFTVTLSAPSPQTVTVDFATIDGTAKAGTDYVANSGSLTFAPGDTTKTIDVIINGDTIDEYNERLYVELSNYTNAILPHYRGVGTINDDDPLPAIAITNVSKGEGNVGTRTMQFIVTLSQVSGRPITVNFATVDGTAKAGSDYVAQSGTLTFYPGQTSKPVNVVINSDTEAESDERFFVQLSNYTNATLPRYRGVGTILNDDTNTPSVTVGDVTVLEGNYGPRALRFTLTLSEASGLPVNVDFTTLDGTATAGSDYVAQNGTLLFNKGQTTRTVTVAVTGDTLLEYDERLYLKLSNPSNTTLSRVQGVGTIQNDDTRVPGLSIDDVTVVEGNNGTRAMQFTVSLSESPGVPVSVNFATVDGTAKAGSDYVAQTGTLTFNKGQTTRTLTVAINGDTTYEADERLYVELSSPTNATISRVQGVGTIQNDDPMAGAADKPSGEDDASK